MKSQPLYSYNSKTKHWCSLADHSRDIFVSLIEKGSEPLLSGDIVPYQRTSPEYLLRVGDDETALYYVYVGYGMGPSAIVWYDASGAVARRWSIPDVALKEFGTDIR